MQTDKCTRLNTLMRHFVHGVIVVALMAALCVGGLLLYHHYDKTGFTDNIGQRVAAWRISRIESRLKRDNPGLAADFEIADYSYDDWGHLTEIRIGVFSLDGKYDKALYPPAYLKEIQKIRDIRALKGLTDYSLRLASTNVRDLSPLRNAHLEELDISNTAVTDLSCLKDCGIVKLFAGKTAIKDITPICQSCLRVLSIPETAVEDISALAQSAIQSLDIGKTRVRDISAIKGKSLISLSVSETPIVDFSAIENNGLMFFYARGTSFSNSDLALLNEDKIIEINVRDTQVTDLAPIGYPGKLYINVADD